MGDSGSQYLGFLFGAGVLVTPHGPVPWGLILLAPLLFDVALTLLRRSARGARVLEPHREHLYQRLSDRWGHARVALVYGVAMVVTGAGAHLYASTSVALQLVAVLLVTAVLASLWRLARTVSDTGP
jgi:UDP-N-acetylmuramyl pentapeptide phosphotransferase/UDP-N-acetylglucosamine-1-phosphate transferase